VSLYFQTKSYLRHWLLEVNEHSIHSPFFFDFYQNILVKTDSFHTFQKLEKLRSDLLCNQTKIQIDAVGSGTIEPTKKIRSLGDIAGTDLSHPDYCELYYRLAKHLNANKILELGTSLGLNTLYLAEYEDARVFTFEGCPAVADIALTNFEYFEKSNINLIEGDINTSLSNFLQYPEKINLILISANFGFQATLEYFSLLVKRVNERSVITINHIHGCKEMELAWEWVKANRLVYGTIDLYHCGIVFFEPSLNKQHFIFSLHKKRSRRNR
jgi:hypothetical protein